MTDSRPVHLILGATSDVAAHLARRLAPHSTLVLAGRRSEPVEALAAEVDGQAQTHVVDGADFDAVDALVDGVLDQHGRLDGVVNCAGSILLQPAHRTSAEDWRETQRANLDTAFAAVRSGARGMLKTGGSIVLVSTAAASVGLINHEAIAAAKAGVDGLVRSAAATYAPRGIRVNAVAPGLVRTKLSAGILRSEASAQASTAMHPLGRLGEPDDVASAIQWLMEPSASWVTGQVVGVDGGLANARPR